MGVGPQREGSGVKGQKTCRAGGQEMSQRKCYIAGKIGDLPEAEYRENFEKAKREVAAMGWEPLSPIDLPHNHGKTWEEHMREDLIALLGCRQVYAMTNWEKSRGTTIELKLALDVGISIIFQKEGGDGN